MTAGVPLGQPGSQNLVLNLEELDLSDKIIRAGSRQHEIHRMKQLCHRNLRKSLPHKGMTTFSNSARSQQFTRKGANFARPVNPAVREFVTFQMWHPWVTLICPNLAEKTLKLSDFVNPPVPDGLVSSQSTEGLTGARVAETSDHQTRMYE